MDFTLGAYKAWVMGLPHTDSDYIQCLLMIPSLSIKQRKVIFTSVRTQAPLVEGCPQLEVAEPMFSTVVYPPLHHGKLDQDIELPATFENIFKRIHPFTMQPIHCSVLSLVLRIAPFTNEDEIIEMISAAFEKEVMASVTIYNPVKMDYTVIFSNEAQDRRLPFSPRLPSDYKTATSIFDAFSGAKSTLQGKILWPDIGSKLVGTKVAEEFWNIYHQSGQDWFPEEDQGVSCRHLERLYLETGYQTQGPVEMRQSWRYNDLKPRVYFARGGSTYFASRYIQSIFNHVIDFFPECHRRDRFLEPENFILDSVDSAIIYDYASFTSTMDEIKNFIHALSIFFQDCFVTIIDSREGPRQISVGKMLEEYNQVCNDHPEFDASSFLPELDQLYHTCGMLGVPGNIFSCTLLHGVHLRFIAGKRNSKTVGDDGKIYRNMGELPYEELLALWFIVESLGEVQWEKMYEFPWREPTDDNIAKNSFHFVKRPYTRVQSRMLSGRLITLPNPVALLGMTDKYHNFPLEDDFIVAMKYRKQLDRMIDSLPLELYEMEDGDRHLLQGFIDSVSSGFSRRLRHGEFKSKKEDKIDPTRLRKLLRTIALELPESLSDYKSAKIKVQQFELDEQIKVKVPFDEKEIDGYEVGCCILGRSSNAIGWLANMGYVETEDQYMFVDRRTYGDDLISQFLDCKYVPLMKATVIRPLPSWITIYL